RFAKLIGQWRRLRHRPELQFRATRSLRDPQSSVETDETTPAPAAGGPARSAGCPRQGTIEGCFATHSPRIDSRAALGGSQSRPYQHTLTCNFVRVQQATHLSQPENSILRRSPLIYLFPGRLYN